MLSKMMRHKKIDPRFLVAGFLLKNPQYEPGIIQSLELTDQAIIEVFKASIYAFQKYSPLSTNVRNKRLISTFDTLSDASKSALQGITLFFTKPIGQEVFAMFMTKSLKIANHQ